MATHFAHAWT